MDGVILALVIVFGLSSYVVGVRQMLKGTYRPNTFSRAIWLLLVINSMAGAILSSGSVGAVVFSVVLLIGNLAMCLVSIKKGIWHFGRLEMVCVALLCVSCIVWVVFSAPLINLAISLAAHFIGALPTYRKVWQDPDSESAAFWLLFAISSVLAVVANGPVAFSAILLPLYYVVFEGSMFLLTTRRYRGLSFVVRRDNAAEVA